MGMDSSSLLPLKEREGEREGGEGEGERGREREREGERGKEREGGREREGERGKEGEGGREREGEKGKEREGVVMNQRVYYSYKASAYQMSCPGWDSNPRTCVACLFSCVLCVSTYRHR